MNVVTLTAEGEHAKAGPKFKVQIGDADFVFAEVHFADADVTGARICTAAGRHPIEDYVVLKHLASGDLETLRPSETSKPSGSMRSNSLKSTGLPLASSFLARFLVASMRACWDEGIPQRAVTSSRPAAPLRTIGAL